MGKALKFDHDKAHRVLAFTPLLELADAIAESITAGDNGHPVTITISGAKLTTLTLSTANLSEVLEILLLTIGED